MGAEVEKLTQRHGDTEVQKRLATKRHKIHKKRQRLERVG
jgi:hypothetical protein